MMMTFCNWKITLFNFEVSRWGSIAVLPLPMFACRLWTVSSGQKRMPRDWADTRYSVDCESNSAFWQKCATIKRIGYWNCLPSWDYTMIMHIFWVNPSWKKTCCRNHLHIGHRQVCETRQWSTMFLPGPICHWAAGQLPGTCWPNQRKPGWIGFVVLFCFRNAWKLEMFQKSVANFDPSWSNVRVGANMF